MAAQNTTDVNVNSMNIGALKLEINCADDCKLNMDSEIVE